MRPGFQDPTLLFPAPEPPLGAAAVVLGGDVYAYSSMCGNLKCPSLLGKAPLKEALDRASWEFFAGEGKWSRDWEDAVPVIDAAHDFSVHWNDYLGKFLAVYSTPVVGATISIRTADRPEGPWSPPREIVDCDLPGKLDMWNGPGMAHPYLTRQDGKTEYLTYFRKIGWLAEELRLLELTFR